jgi:hypothetical protein
MSIQQTRIQLRSTLRVRLPLHFAAASSASAYRRAEDVGVGAVVVAELKLRDVKRQVFGADFVECADHAAFEDRPKAFNRVRVDCADNVLMPAVIDCTTRVLAQVIAVARPRVRRQQTHLVGDRFADEIDNGLGRDFFQNAGHDIALALHGANDRSFAAERALFLIPMPVGIFAAM